MTKPQVILSADPTVILPAAPAQVVDGILESQGIDPHGRYIGFALRPWPGLRPRPPSSAPRRTTPMRRTASPLSFCPSRRRLDVGAAQLAAQHMKAPTTFFPRPAAPTTPSVCSPGCRRWSPCGSTPWSSPPVRGVPLVGVVYDQKISSFLSYIGRDLYTGLDEVTEEALRAHIDAACARIGDEAFLSGGVERLRQVERRNSETARMLLER